MSPYSFESHPHIGDNIICTGAIRNVKAAHPGIIFARPTVHPEIWNNNPDVLDVAGSTVPLPKITYGPLAEEQRGANGNVVEGFTKSLCQLLGIAPVPIVTRQPCLQLSDAEMEATEKWHGKIILNANCQKCSRSKGYPHWQQVCDILAKDFEIIQVGGNEPRDISPDLDGVTDMRGRTSIRDLFVMVRGSSLVLSPPSCISNIAGAFATLQIIVNASREPDRLLDYPNAVHISHVSRCGWGVSTGCIVCTFDGRRRCTDVVSRSSGQWSRCQWETSPDDIAAAALHMLQKPRSA